MLIKIQNVSEHGIIRDKPSHELPVNAWSDGKNVRITTKGVEKSKGHADVFDPPGVAPYMLLPMQSDTAQLWVYAGLAKLRVVEGATHFDITRLSGDYTGGADDIWTGGLLGGIAILNNGVDNPQQWAGDTGVEAADLTNWPDPAFASMTARVIRSFKNYLFAGDLTQDGTQRRQLVKWSSAAESGSVPSTWDPTDATNDSGEKYLSDTSGSVMTFDGIGDINVIYKEDSVHTARFIGGDFVWAWGNLSELFGVFTPNCVKAIPIIREERPRRLEPKPQSLVMGYDDIVINDGRTLVSAMEEKLRRWFFAQINSAVSARSFLAVNVNEKEILCCIPLVGSDWPNFAAVWNWQENSWGFRDLPEVASMQYGPLDPGAALVTWASLAASETWANTTRRWNDRSFNPTLRNIMMASPSNVKFYQFDETDQFSGVNFLAEIERRGLAVQLDRFGTPHVDIETTKLVTEVYPKFEGTGTVDIHVGAQEVVDGPVTWAPPLPFEIGVTHFVTPFVSGRIPAFRFSSESGDRWILKGFDFEQKVVGKHW